MGRWLARFSFTFLIISALLVIQGYRELTGRVQMNKARVALCFVGAGLGLALTIRGIRERHRSTDTSNDDEQPPEGG
jgi:hypothetical protein